MKFLKRSPLVMLLLSLCLFALSLAGCAKSKGVLVGEGRVVEPYGIEQAIEPKPVYVGEIESSKKKLVEENSSVATMKPAVTQKIEVKPPEISMEQLIERLKMTESIGFLTKLAIRSDVLDFKQSVESHRKRGVFEANAKMLREYFNGLLLKILALLERDPTLSRDIHLARESIWKSLVEAKS